MIRSHQPYDEGYTLEVNEFADMTPEEFEKKLGLIPFEPEDEDGDFRHE